MSIHPFLPPKRILLGPGPSEVPPRVLRALSRPTIGHLDPEFIRMMDEVKEMLQQVFQTKNATTFVVSGPGSAGMESCFVNLIEPGDKVVVCQNGVFGGRMKEIVERCGGLPITIEEEWGKPVDPNKLELTLQSHRDTKIVAWVHAETSTGVESDVKTLSAIAREYHCLTIVDTVTSLGGIPVKVDEWEIDAVYAGSQKCLSCTPGLSPVTFSDRAVEAVKRRKTKVQSWFLDLNLLTSYWGNQAKRAYHHTAPINALYGLHEALLMILEEGLENGWDRHQQNHRKLKAGLESLGFSFLIDEKVRLPQLNAILVPHGLDDKLIRDHLLNEYRLEIGAGLGTLSGKIWRIGLMGYSSNQQSVDYCVNALKGVIS